MRQALIATPEIELVAPIGKRMTLISPGESSLFSTPAASEATFEQAIANLCSSKWLFTRDEVDSMTGKSTRTEELLDPKDAANEIFRVGGTECFKQFRAIGRTRTKFMGATSLVAIRSFRDEDLVWKGRAKSLYEGDALPANGVLTGKALGFARAKITGVESLAWAYAKCAQGQGTLAMYQPGSAVVQDEERMFTILANSYVDPYEIRGLYSEVPYFLGCRGARAFVLKVSRDQGMLFEAGRTLESLR
ncbi:hypothetical protein [Ralstonia pseudosolanacearum]|uniref:hypothetical protein n=1 Tax=Ralstonia pseudosolanacearum TaxID=1310165 RepID=UPI0018D12FA3|nr:hypothetical protein [Ralstonia pseudosolanacearum]